MRKGGIDDDEPGTMVIDPSLLLNGRLCWRRPLRARCPYTHMECVAAIFVFNHTTRYGSPPSTVLDPRSAITLFILVTLFLTWNDITVRRLLLTGVASYIVMRIWSGLFFIPEMLAFQKIPFDSAPSADLSARVARWTYWTWFREPLDVISFLCFLLALYWLGRS